MPLCNESLYLAKLDIFQAQFVSYVQPFLTVFTEPLLALWPFSCTFLGQMFAFLHFFCSLLLLFSSLSSAFSEDPISCTHSLLSFLPVPINQMHLDFFKWPGASFDDSLHMLTLHLGNIFQNQHRNSSIFHIPYHVYRLREFFQHPQKCDSKGPFMIKKKTKRTKLWNIGTKMKAKWTQVEPNRNQNATKIRPKGTQMEPNGPTWKWKTK